jgi:uncharacterized protein (DUF924 family)
MPSRRPIVDPRSRAQIDEPNMTADPRSVCNLWFGDDLDSPEAVAERQALWFSQDATFDDLIRRQFAELPDRAVAGELENWGTEPQRTLALTLVLDQFPRNLYRGIAQAFAYDAAALEVARDALSRQLDQQVHPLEAAFLYLPFEHAEDRASQARSVSLFRALAVRAPAALSGCFEEFLRYAEQHQDVIDEFGRFPHRNSVLGRPSTPTEVACLESDRANFFGADSTT